MRPGVIVLMAALACTPAVGATETWYAPEAAYAGHPMHLAVLAHDEAQGEHEHVEMPVSVMIGNRPVFFSDSIHEHDGYHTFLFTPPRAGMLSAAIRDATMTDFVGEPMSGNASRYTTRNGVAVVPIVAPQPATYHINSTKDLRLDWRPSDADYIGFISTGIGHGQPVTPLFDLRDADGRLIASAIPRYFHAAWMMYEAAFTSGTARAFVLPAYYSPEPLFSQTSDYSWSGSQAPVAPGGAPLPPEPCGASLFVDPNPTFDGIMTWHDDTTLRVAPSSGPEQAPMVYHLWRHTPGGTYRVFYNQLASDPFGALTFGGLVPGQYQLVADPFNGTTCALTFTILPNPDKAPGDVRIDATIADGRNATVSLAATRDGTALPHYEFETRIYRNHTAERPGMLLWAGKLHGHDGAASLTLYDLAPGTYHVHTYPSPQDLGTPPVATDDPAGFTATFTIPAPPAPAPTASTDEALPAPAAALPGLLVALALLLRLRRR